MPRSVKTDYLQSFRFNARAFDANNVQRLVFNPATALGVAQADADAGFAQCGVPRVTVESATYREGTMIYTRRQPGVPDLSPITLQRGAIRGDSTMWGWGRQVVEGQGEYRCTLEIAHFARDKAYEFSGGLTTDQAVATPMSTPQNRLQNLTSIKSDSPPGRIYILFEAWPSDYTPASDFDANSSEVSLQELEITYEYFEVLEDVT